MYLAKVLTIVSLFAALFAIGNAKPKSTRLSGGQKVDSLKSQFPFYVYILPSHGFAKCGGSIISERWVLTSARCIRGSSRLELSFGKQNEFDNTAGYFSLSVNSDQVFEYPTGFDDVALIKLPLELDFEDGNIGAVIISTLTAREAQGITAVMPGFHEPHTAYYVDSDLRYGLFTILEQSSCTNRLGSTFFNEYSNVCAEGWGVDQNTACRSDYGNGLIVGWPSEPRLIGLYSMESYVCVVTLPGTFTFVPKYWSWIMTMTGLTD